MAKIKCVCKVCGEEFYKNESQIRGKNTFCSQKCKSIFQLKGKKFKCEICGKIFYKSKVEIKRNQGRFCSWKCRYTPRELIIKKDYALVPLTQGKFAIIDLEDVEKVSKCNWIAHKGRNTYYAIRMEKKSRNTIRLHRFLLELKKDDGIIIDHWSGDGLDNRRCNIRICTCQQNCINSKSRIGTSKYKGVSFKRDGNKFVSYTSFNGKRLWLGSFDDEIEAAKAYDRKIIELHKEFARTNFPKENYI